MAEAVRLVIWDLDETFWRGALTEGGVAYRTDTHDIVVELAARGVMSTICSKNDFEPVKAMLVEKRIWDYFIFPSIDWTPKGPRIKRLIETVQLRPESVMLIDDNHLNLEEAKFFAPGVRVAPETVIPTILADPLFKGKDDRALSRLKQYKVLEARKTDEECLRETTGGGNIDFLRASDIQVRIDNDVEANLDRAIELINRTNQLNYIKRRLPENIDEARERLRREISHFTTQAGLVEVSDKYGDYGYCGYFQLTTRRDVTQLSQFCFSCRILGMGVEAWVFQRLGKPTLQIRGEVLSDPTSHGCVDWIRLVSGQTASSGDSAGAEEPILSFVAARGGCNLWPLAHYFRLSSSRVVAEFNTIRDGKLISLDHSLCLRHAILGVTEEQLAAVAPLGYIADDFHTEYFDYSGDQPLWIFSNWIDVGMRVFRHHRTGITIPCVAPRSEEQAVAHQGLETYLEAEFSPFVYDETEFKKTLTLVFSKIPRKGLMFVLLSLESEGRPNRRRQERNRWCAEAAAAHPNVRLLRMADFIDDEAEILNTNRTHYDRKVYYRLYLHVMALAAADLAEQRPRSAG